MSTWQPSPGAVATTNWLKLAVCLLGHKSHQVMSCRTKVLASFRPMRVLVVIGYPSGIWDSVHNLPILRSANTATPLDIDYKGRPQFLINGACFSGSSGSPIFLANEGSYADRGGLVLGNRLFLVGVLSATYTQSLQGEIMESEIPTSSTLVSIARLPIHLGICIKAREILRLAEVAKQRHAAAAAA